MSRAETTVFMTSVAELLTRKSDVSSQLVGAKLKGLSTSEMASLVSAVMEVGERVGR